MGRNCARALEQGHSFSPFGPTLPVNNRFFTQNNKTPSNAALPFQFFIENIFKLKLFIHAIQFCTREI